MDGLTVSGDPGTESAFRTRRSTTALRNQFLCTLAGS